MSYLDGLRQEPWRHDFFAVMRRIERSLERMGPHQPRIGESATLAQEKLRVGSRTVGFTLGQDPFLQFPASTVSRVTLGDDADGRVRVLSRFLGLLGPQGALPLAITEEAYGYLRDRDEAFARFLDLFNNRFQQLFFRAWANVRPAAQHDRPAQDRFLTYVGCTVGLGSAPYRDRDTIPDLGKLAYAGLLAPQARSASRLRGAIMGLFGVRTEIEQFVGAWLPIETADRTRMGRVLSRLGAEILVGGSVFSIQDRFRIVILVNDIEQYRAFLPEGSGADQPAGRHCGPLVDLVFFYLGNTFEWDVELAIPAAKAPPTRLGQSGMLGWTTWMPFTTQAGPALRRDARFRPAERARASRERPRAAPAEANPGAMPLGNP